MRAHLVTFGSGAGHQHCACARCSALCLQVTAFIAVPAMLEDLLAGTSDGALAATSTRVERILVGAAPLSRRLAAACQSAFPMAAIVSAYGMTETCSSICFSRVLPSNLEVENMAVSPGSPADDSGQCVGCPPPGIEVATDMTTGAPSTSACAHICRHAAVGGNGWRDLQMRYASVDPTHFCGIVARTGNLKLVVGSALVT